VATFYVARSEIITPLPWLTFALPFSNLGVMYGLGKGVAENLLISHMWFNIAASLGNAKGAENRELVAERLTQPLIAEAQGFARDCIASAYKNCRK
jgi:TPR repeat protein